MPPSGTYAQGLLTEVARAGGRCVFGAMILVCGVLEACRREISGPPCAALLAHWVLREISFERGGSG